MFIATPEIMQAVRHIKLKSSQSQRRQGIRIKSAIFFCTPPETKLFLQCSVIAAASQQTSPSAQRCSPIKEKQTGDFDFVNLTCKQHDRAKSPTSHTVSWGLSECVKEIFARQRGKFCAYICLCMHNVLEWCLSLKQHREREKGGGC